MQVAVDAPKRPALRYYGGKWNLASWIISYFPKHLNYVEPCGGAASVLLQKPRSPLETYNDLDGNVVNFFRVLRDQPNELIRKIKLTPWAYAEYTDSFSPNGSDVERARLFFVASWMSMQGGTADEVRGTWRIQKHVEARFTMPIDEMLDTEKELDKVAVRLRRVQIDNRPFSDVVTRYDTRDTLIYADPPYVASTRSNAKCYAFEWTDENHIESADLLRNAAGYVVVSGYACPLYTDLYERHGWQRVDRMAQTNSGGKRIESLWLSPRTVEALAKPAQAGLFA